MCLVVINGHCGRSLRASAGPGIVNNEDYV
jgi:hypothetical protein